MHHEEVWKEFISSDGKYHEAIYKDIFEEEDTPPYDIRQLNFFTAMEKDMYYLKKKVRLKYSPHYKTMKRYVYRHFMKVVTFIINNTLVYDWVMLN